MNYAYEEKERLTYVMLEIFLRKAAFSVGFSNFWRRLESPQLHAEASNKEDESDILWEIIFEVITTHYKCDSTLVEQGFAVSIAFAYARRKIPPVGNELLSMPSVILWIAAKSRSLTHDRICSTYYLARGLCEPKRRLICFYMVFRRRTQYCLNHYQKYYGAAEVSRKRLQKLVSVDFLSTIIPWKSW